MERNSRPRVYGLIGYPVRHSLSPAMHNAAFAALKINAEYRLFEVKPEELKDFLLSDKPAQDIDGNPIPKSDIFGFNITIPHKVKAKEILENKLSFDNKRQLVLENEYYVRLSGAINTVKKEGNKLNYYNTDASGFLRSLKHDLKFETKNKNALIIGCGGAGRAIISALSWKNTGVKKIYVNDISKEAVDLARRHFAQFPHLKDKLVFIQGQDLPKFIKECQLLVNATPVGMKGEDVSIMDKELLHEGLCVYDVVYNKEGPTRLIKDAQSKGLSTQDGLSMLLWQGVGALNLWLNPIKEEDPSAPVEIMRRALMEAAGR